MKLLFLNDGYVEEELCSSSTSNTSVHFLTKLL